MIININRGFVYGLRPERMLKITFTILVVMIVLAPISPVFTFTFSSFFYLLLNVMAFILGTKMIKAHKDNNQIKQLELDYKKTRRVYRLSFILGFVGVVARYIDLFVIRKVSLLMTTIENAEAMMESSANIFSIVAAFLIFFTYVPVTLDVVIPQLNKKIWKISGLILFFSTAIVSLITSSRFALITPSFFFFVLLLYSGRVRFNFNIKRIIIYTVVALTIASVSGSLFQRRLEDQGVSLDVSISGERDGYSKYVPATEEYKKLMVQSADEWYSPIVFSYCQFPQYFVHGVFEFPAVMDYMEKNDYHTYGAATFNAIVKFFYKLAGQKFSYADIEYKYNLRPGIWSTFFFEWFLDFGWFGIFFSIIMGFLAKKVWYIVYIKNNIFYLPLLCFLCIVWLLIFQLNFFNGGGTYAMFVFISYPILLRVNKCFVKVK